MSGGSIRPKGSHGWEIRVSDGYEVNGRRRRVSRYVTGSRKDAEQALLRLRLEVGDGSLGRGDATTIEDVLIAWLSLAAGGLEANTVEGYRYVCRQYLIPQLGQIQLRKLDPARIDRFYADISREGVRGRPLAPASVRQVHATLRRGLQQAVKWGWIDRNPAALASPPRTTAGEIRPPSVTDVQVLIDAARARDDDLADWLTLAVMTGARRGEIAGLQWTDIDFDAQTLTIRRAVVDVGGEVTVKSPKTHATRRLTIDVATLDMMRARRVRLLEDAFKSGVHLGPWCWSMPDDVAHTDPIRPDSISGKHRRLAARLGVDARLHDLRHLNVSLALAATGDVAAVAKRAGHRSAKMTLDTYGHVMANRDQAAADAVAAAFRR